MEADRDEADDFGQKTRDTFYLADVFIRLGNRYADELSRFLGLIFGHPYPKVSEGQRLSAARRKLRNTGIFDVTEFGRAVHAEMDALLCAGRTGTSARDSTLYTTTFPCHNCARHLIAAGVNRVVYIEPYPKSKASLLHADSIAIEEPGSEHKIPFEPFLGIGPRRYFDLFSMALSTGYPLVRKKNGRVLEWKHSNANPRVPMQPTSYLHRELRAAQEIENIVELKGINKVK